MSLHTALATVLLLLKPASALMSAEWSSLLAGNEEFSLFPTDERSAFGSAISPGSRSVLGIGLGFAKCGTTFMNMVLNEHENFYQTHKESHYLLPNDELSRCKRAGPPNSTSDYINDCFDGRWPKKGEATLDFTPRYGIYSNVQSLMETVKVLQQTTHNVTLRFLVSLRDPVIRAESTLSMMRRLNTNGWLTKTDAELDEQLVNNLTDRAHTDGFYYQALRTWLRSFPKHSLLVVNMKSLSDHETWKRIYSHLGLAVPSESQNEQLLQKVKALYWERQGESFMSSGASPYSATLSVKNMLNMYYERSNEKLWELLKTDPWW
mmetsp:Transcript_64251/g.139804  ORF Transcript_64251/g.139804 Transcript_64251/m.139804 type:complete len:321 (-) Transcript_64251:126-1088(-)